MATSHVEHALFNLVTTDDAKPHFSRSDSISSIAISVDQIPSSPMSVNSATDVHVKRILSNPPDTLVNSLSVHSEDFVDSGSPDKKEEQLSTRFDEYEGSQPLSDRCRRMFLLCVVNIGLAFLPLLFISLTIVAAGLNGHSISSLGHKVQEAAKLGPTIYPIVFAAIVARYFRHLAQWQAEKGQSLGILEQLVQSQSFAGSIQAAMKLRNIRSASFAITVIWALSPIGGQTSLRLLSVTEAEGRNQHPYFVHYPSSETLGLFCDVVENTVIPGVIDDILTKALNTVNITRSSAVDSWGNIKIPGSDFLAQAIFSNDNQDPEPNPWVAVTPGENNLSYSSLIGIPLWDIPNQGMANFSLEWPIYNTDCHWEPPGYDEREWQEIINNHAADEDLVPCSRNITSVSSILTSNFTMTTEYEKQLNSTSSPSYVQMDFSVPGSHVIDNVQYSGFQIGCKIRTSRVEAQVSCQRGACSVIRIRRSEKDLKPDFLNPWNDDSVPYAPTIKKQVFQQFLEFLPGMIGATTSGYISGQPYVDFQDQTTWWETVSDEQFSSRFSQIFNTIWIVSQWPLDIKYRPDREIPAAARKAANATITEKYPVYQANFICIALLIAVSTILLFCALGSLVLELSISGPDIFGFISSLTRDNEYFDPIPGGSVLSGTERARKLKDLQVQIVDVRPDREIGHIALTACGRRGTESVRPRLRVGVDRLYD